VPGKRVSMRKTREVLRLYYELKLGQRQIARSANVSQSTVHDYLERFQTAGLSWPLPAGMSEAKLGRNFFGNLYIPPQQKAIRDLTWQTANEI
jgi:hypothetical protein